MAEKGGEQTNIREDDLPPETWQHLEKAYTYDEKGEVEKALAECELAIQLAPNWAEAHNLHGMVLEKLSQPEKAIASYSEAVRLDPAFEPISTLGAKSPA